MISAIAAVAGNDMLGLEGWLPWDIPEELAYFEQTVAGAALLVGRMTYESMESVPVDTFVLSRDSDYVVRAGCTRVSSVASGLIQAVATGKPVFVIGGASVYAAAWPYCRRFYLTRIGMDCAGDTLFPESVHLADWKVLSERKETYLERRSNMPVVCRFMQYEQANPLRLSVDHCLTAHE